ncbi:hypothetical protein [Oceanobacillus alkalisoli]|uniref:hypothetical protein n=1 Tax=Oceanobacillus alkalisoli TaxID=2925113 RepID=UPI001EF0503C|nr:hypothetical protein [Oceanobacillus alkalisoli]MCF3942048.1 hypothetical protein [Oceanobacillus alkalisoli]MCG5101999.1 hypothetical protein [Oceanobacillus alkalisoli]
MRFITEEEYAIASRFLFLSMAIVVIRQDIRHVGEGAFKIKTPYLELFKKMESLALEERRGLRIKMKKQNIEVITLNKNDSFSSFLYLCQGREEKRNYFNPSIRKKVELIIEEHLILALEEHANHVHS